MVSFRQACVDDIDAIMRLENECFGERVREEAEVFMQRINVFPAGFILLFDDEQLIGCISSEVRDSTKSDEKTYKTGHSIARVHDDGGDELYISSFAISPSFRGCGFGGLLLKELLDVFSLRTHIKFATLIVARDWAEAVGLCEKMGFVVTGEVPKLLKNGVMMRKEM